MKQKKKMNLESKEFIESVVGVPVSSWSSVGACNEGDNMAGSVKTLTIITKANQQIDLIFKQIPETPPDWIIQGQIFRIEHGVYRTIFPALKSLVASKGSKYEPPIPKCYKGYNNDKDDYLVLEDLRPQGFKMQDKRVCLTFPEMHLILEELAKFHSLSFALLRHEGEQILQTSPDYALLIKPIFPPEEDKPDGPDGFDFLLQLYFQVGCDLMSARLPHLASRINSIVSNGWKIRRDATNDPKYFQTIIHSDLWTNNLLLKYDDSEGKKPVGVKFIDFQFTHVGNIFSDLQYLFFTSTTTAFRKEFLDRLLCGYFAVFSSTLESIGCPMPIGFSKGFLLNEFGKWLLPGIVHMPFAIGLQLGSFSEVLKEWGERGIDPDTTMADPSAIKEMFLRSPLAIARLQELFEEAAAANVF